MYTQCPKCLTYFQVTADHLKVAQGNVRCGQCSNVFSALGNLSESPPQQNSSTSGQKSRPPSNSQKGAPRNTPAARSETGNVPNNAQSKLSTAIAAIQALNQSSQKILSQGRKNYVTQLQKQAQAKKKYSSTSGGSTARDLSQDSDLEAAKAALADANMDHNIDIEEALAAVDGIGFDGDGMPLGYGDSVDEALSSLDDSLPPDEDTKSKYSGTSKNKPGTKKRAKIIKTDSVDDDIFDFSEFDLPDEQSSAAKQTKAKNLAPEKENNARKKSSRKKFAKSADVKPAPRKSVESSREEEIEEIVLSVSANEQPIVMPQQIISDPEVIIENNIPTLAIPKALLEDFEKEKTSHASYRSMLTWGGLSVLMMLVFLGQAIYFKHNELGQISQLRPWIQMFCKHASCELSMQTDIGQIELLGQDIRSHPKNEKALLVSATIINNASFTQPYPGLQLSFSDMNGVKVATRNFMPKDYLPSKYSSKKGMESNIPIQLELELVDPGKSAVNFEFDFFSM